jgi:hypothetical protein
MFCDLVGNTELSTRVDRERLREVVRVGLAIRSCKTSIVICFAGAASG